MFYYTIDEETELRILELRHAEALFQLTDSCRDYLREWLPWVDATQSPEDTKSFIRLSLKQFAENNGFTAGIFYNGQIAGTISFHSFDWANKSTSIGYWLGKLFQDKGIMSSA
ncbi:GCN5-like N-acetyltransferase [Caldalkalibacillus thermarum TA2.A1]|uniref:GCN5-like N-acetyltransferase n=1 Tax=Caldalkalibacillus thermarum (strain TA2.A1) TaxID=986075 RepID=F5L5K7_CALTT|nr:GNAT family N-acetyltransferase [Caldalkalibacillus thermarum]EGL83363.1 GCN5-like N-acetyltransferase [Caldalkalibacillus thermarum TA2.A1]QZT32874.1 GNAT family N-acetyltransferase [Caldalkalibacillus thermarum TA2.A1]